MSIPKTIQRNARFWVWHNGDFVKLTLRPGQVLSFEDGGPTDEGWRYSCERYECDGDEGKVYLQADTQAQDCDGRFDTIADLFCSIHDLAVVGARITGDDFEPLRPDCQTLKRSQRDHAAEAMGY